MWSTSEDHAHELFTLSLGALCRAMGTVAGGATAARFGCLSNITPAQGFPLVLQHASHAVAPRVALVGDTAHVIHPLTRQSMNLGLRNVSEIGRVMAERETMRDHGDLGLLHRYERTRREDLLSLTAATDSLRKPLVLPGALPRTAYNVGIRMVDTTSSIKHLLIKHTLG